MVKLPLFVMSPLVKIPMRTRRGAVVHRVRFKKRVTVTETHEGDSKEYPMRGSGANRAFVCDCGRDGRALDRDEEPG